MIAYSSNCLISQEWLASIVEGDSIINATLLTLLISININKYKSLGSHCISNGACSSGVNFEIIRSDKIRYVYSYVIDNPYLDIHC